MARVLLMPHAPTGGLAHVGACLALGGELRARGHDVAVAYGGTRPEVIEHEGFPWHAVPEVAPEREWEPSGWFASTDELLALVQARVELIDRVRPDVAVSSSGVAGRLACEAARVPQLHLMHYLPGSVYGRRPVVWSNRLRDARRPRRLARVVRARLRARRRRSLPSTLATVVRARAALGLAPPGAGAVAGCRDSLVALTTAPFVDPASGLPDHWRYVGPVTWSAPSELPSEVDGRGRRPLVYVTQGSTGDPALLRRAVAELASEPVDVLATTGGLCAASDLTGAGPNVYAAPLLSGRACIEAADAAVIHGGHLTLSEAFLTGTPVVVLPYRRDQIGHVNRVERLGAGIGVWPAPRLTAGIRRAVRRVLTDASYGERSRELARRLGQGWDGSQNSADLVEDLLDRAR